MEQGVTYSPTPAPQEPTPTPQTQPSRSILPIVAIVAVGVILLAISLARYGLNKSKGGQNPPSVTTSGEVTPSEIISQKTKPIETIKSGWNPYQDANDTFAVQYPQEYTLDTYQESTFKGIELSLNKPESSASSSANINLKIIYLKDSAKNANQFANDQAGLENVPISSSKFKEFDSFELPLKGEWGRGKIIFFEKGSTVYRISYIIAAPLNFVANYEGTINQILSTFKIPVLDPERSK